MSIDMVAYTNIDLTVMTVAAPESDWIRGQPLNSLAFKKSV